MPPILACSTKPFKCLKDAVEENLLTSAMASVLNGGSNLSPQKASILAAPFRLHSPFRAQKGVVHDLDHDVSSLCLLGRLPAGGLFLSATRSRQRRRPMRLSRCAAFKWPRSSRRPRWSASSAWATWKSADVLEPDRHAQPVGENREKSELHPSVAISLPNQLRFAAPRAVQQLHFKLRRQLSIELVVQSNACTFDVHIEDLASILGISDPDYRPLVSAPARTSASVRRKYGCSAVGYHALILHPEPHCMVKASEAQNGGQPVGLN